jgi:hypothetical protein
VDHSGETPMALAYRIGRWDALRVLCEHGVNPKFKPFHDVPSVYERALAEKNREALKLFIEANLKVK